MTQLALEEKPGMVPSAFEGVTEQLARGAEMSIQAAWLVARKFPRNEDQSIQKIHRACCRPKLADAAAYSFPRGNQQVTGPTIVLLREIARSWGNLDSGYQIIGETKEGCLIRAYAWDMESNRVSHRDHYLERKVQRTEYQKDKETGKKQKVSVWETPDPRDWREWQGNIGSRLERSQLEAVIPGHIIESAMEWAAETRIKEIAEDPDKMQKQLLAAFDVLNVTPDDIELVMGKPVKKLSPMELDKLRGIWKAIDDGQKTIFDYLPASREAQEQAKERALDKAEKAKEKVDPDLLLTTYLQDIGIPIAQHEAHVKEHGRDKLLKDAENWRVDNILGLNDGDAA